MALTDDLPRVTGRHRNRALAAARQAKAVDLAAAGRTYQQVADELGYTSRGTAYNIVTKALKGRTLEAVETLRDLENARLDALQRGLWEAALAGDVKAVDAVLHIVKARVRVNGLEPDRKGSPAAATPRTLVVRLS